MASHCPSTWRFGDGSFHSIPRRSKFGSMLAANCPRCGALTPLSLASPETVACRHCGEARPAPHALTVEILGARETLKRLDPAKRQLSAIQKSLLESRAPGCLRQIVTFVVSVPLFVIAARYTIDYDTPRWLALVSYVPLLVLFIASTTARVWMNRQRANILTAWRAIAPKGDTHSARCRVCGTPISTSEDSVVSRCSYCHADNLTEFDASASTASATAGRYDQEIVDAASPLRAASTAARVLVVGVTVVAPVTAIALTVIAGFAFERIRIGPDATWSYAVWPTGDGKCLGVVRPRGDKLTLDFGGAKLRGLQPDLEMPTSTKVEMISPNDLVGRKVFHEGRVAVVQRVYRTLDSKTNGVELDSGGASKTARIPGLCLVREPAPERVATIGGAGNHMLRVSASALLWVRGGSIFAVPASGGEPAAKVERSANIDDMEADATHFFIADGSGVHAIPLAGGEAVKLADAASPRDLCLDGSHVYYAAGGDVWRVAKTGGAPQVLAKSLDAHGLVVSAGRLYFHSVKAGSVSSVPIEGGPSKPLLSGQKLAPGMPLMVEGESITFLSQSNQVLEVPIAGGMPKTVAGFGERPEGYARRGHHVVFWVNAERDGVSGGVFHVRAGGAGRPDNLVPTAGRIGGAVFYGDEVIWVDETAGHIMRAKLPSTVPGTVRLPDPMLKKPIELPKRGK